MDIYERAAGLPDPGAMPSAPASTTATLVASWTQAFSPGDQAAFHRRLAWDDLTPDLVAIASTADVAANDTWTAWLDGLEDAAQSVLRDVVFTGTVPERAWFEPEREPPFVECFAAMLRATRPAPASRLLTDAARIGLEKQLLTELATYGALAIYEQFASHVRQASGGAPADSGRTSLYRQFIVGLLNDQFVGLFTAYPVLARQMALVATRWAINAAELLQRTEADLPTLSARLAGGAPLGTIASIEPGLSDPHDGRRRVSVLTFSNGTRAVYKPRSLAIDTAFFGLIEWLRRAGLESTPPCVAVVDRESYGWTAFVGPALFESQAAVREYFRRAGVLLLLTHLLGSRDMHMENVVATADGPALIDLEMLLQPERTGGDPDDSASHATTRAESCLRSGLLSMIETGPDGVPYDMGGLRGTGKTALSVERGWVDLGTDAVRPVERPARPATIANVVLTSAGAAAPDAFAAEIVQGFTEAYSLILDRREAFVAAGGPLAQFRDAEVRILVRPTHQYGLLSATRNSPRYQRDAIAHGIIVDAMHRAFSASHDRPREWSLAREERAVTAATDVPRFVVRADDVAVRSNGRTVLASAYGRSAIDAVRDRVSRMSSEDLRRQRQILSRAVGQSLSSRFLVAPPSITEGPASGDLVTLADWVGRELLAHADGSVTPIDTTSPWHGDAVTEPLQRHVLYEGSLGPALFFAALAASTGSSTWKERARAAVRPALDAVGDAPDNGPEVLTIGGCSGLGSIAHALLRIGGLLGDEDAVRAAERVARWITPDRIAGDTAFDVMDGAAGAILALLALNGERPAASLVDAAHACGEHLIRTHIERQAGWAWPSPGGQYLTGFAHGAAGIGAALAQAGAVTRTPAFIHSAVQAFTFVNALFSAADANWPLAEPSDGRNPGSMNAWCHGAPGIAAAGAMAAGAGFDALAGAASVALATIARDTPGQADHLCCGRMGRAEALLTIGRLSSNQSAVGAARTIALASIARASKQQHFRLSGAGPEYLVFLPGFYRGLSGIGYQLLRLANPDRVPSMLFFGSDMAGSGLQLSGGAAAHGERRP